MRCGKDRAKGGRTRVESDRDIEGTREGLEVRL